MNDFFSKEMMRYSVISFFIALLLFGIFIFFLFKLLIHGFSEFIIYAQITDEIAVIESIKNYLASFTLLKYLLAIDFFAMLFNIIIALNIFILLYFTFMFFYSIVIAFFASQFVKSIQNKHYQDVDLQSMGILYIVWIYFKTTTITLFFVILFLPFFFIPTLNFLLFIPLYYFFHKSLLLDVSSAINTKKEYLKIKKANWFELKFQTLVLFLISLVPIVGIILIPFYFIYIAHIIFDETKVLRNL